MRKNKFIKVRVEKEVFDMVKETAKEDGITVSELIRKAIVLYLKNR